MWTLKMSTSCDNVLSSLHKDHMLGSLSSIINRRNITLLYCGLNATYSQSGYIMDKVMTRYHSCSRHPELSHR